MKILKWKLFLEELVGDKAISNYDEYNKGMEKSIDDFDVEITHSTHTKLIIKNNNFR